MSDAGVNAGSVTSGLGAAMGAAAAPVSRGAAWKIVVSVVVVTGAIGGLLWRSTQAEMQFYRHVDELLAQKAELRGKRLQVHGHVRDIEQKKGTLEYRFVIESRPPRAPGLVTANYTGIVPDTFKPGSEVVASGLLAPDDTLKVSADGIMAKCPSKYEASKSGTIDKSKY